MRFLLLSIMALSSSLAFGMQCKLAGQAQPFEIPQPLLKGEYTILFDRFNDSYLISCGTYESIQVPNKPAKSGFTRVIELSTGECKVIPQTTPITFSGEPAQAWQDSVAACGH